MSSFSPTDAAFSVFPLIKRYPRFVGLVLAVAVPIGLITAALFSFGAGEAFAAYTELVARNPNIQPEEMSAILELVNVPLTLLMVLFATVANAMLAGLILRKTVLNQDPTGLGLRFASLEVRLILANLALFGICFLAMTLLLIVLGLLGAIIGEGMGPVVLLATLIPVMMTLLGIFLVGRLGLYGVAAAATDTLGLKAAWEISRRAFWQIVGALVLWTIASVVMTMVFQAIVTLLLGVSGQEGNLIQSPQGIMASALLSAFGGFTQLGTICVGAFAWHQMQANAPQTGQGAG